MLPILLRAMAPGETAMVLSNWKRELDDDRKARRWGQGLTDRDYWCLVNHVIDKIALPSCLIVVGVHAEEPETPICWAACRREPGLTVYEIVYLYARQVFREERELGLAVERAFLAELVKEKLSTGKRPRPFNPFLELRT